VNVQSAAVRLHQPSEGILVASASCLQQPPLVHAVIMTLLGQDARRNPVGAGSAGSGLDGRSAAGVLAL
jgi:hypothetical protein